MESTIRRVTSQEPDEEHDVQGQLEELAKVRKEIERKRADKEKVVKLGEKVLGKCHPRAETAVHEILTRVVGRWKELEELNAENDEKLKHVSPSVFRTLI